MAVGLYYDAHHAIPNPVERGDDLGVGLVGILWASIALIVAIPLIVLLTKFIARTILRHLGRN